ncbi:MAG: acylneuraminate cytidylyltransferase family protein [Patescibacteria group bacterium]
MYKDKKILCIIPARGGSRRLPGKNIKLLNGVPLIGYAIRAAKGSQYVDTVIVSTDDEEIARVAREQGADMPFMRPTELASDTATTLPVLEHAVGFLEEKGLHFDLILLIQPTVPGVESHDVDAAIEKLVVTGANSCVSVCEIVERPEWMYRMGEGARVTPYVETTVTHSQDMEKLYRVNGAVYVMTHDTVMKRHLIRDNESCVAVMMPMERSTDIDTPMDFIIAETLLTKP